MRNRKYTDEMIEWLRVNVPGHLHEASRKEFMKKFGVTCSRSAFYTFCAEHDIRTGRISRVYKPEVIQFMRENAPGRFYSDLAKMVNEQFGMNKTTRMIKEACGNYGISNGKDDFFKKGGSSWLSGKKGFCAEGSEKGWFKKGHVNATADDLFTIKLKANGFWMIKVANPATWMMLSHFIWNCNHPDDPVTDEEAVVYLDGNRNNCSLRNLMKTDRRNIMILNGHYKHTTGDLRRLAWGIALTKKGVKNAGRKN